MFFQELNLPVPVDKSSVEEILNLKRNSEYRPYLFLTKQPVKFLTKEIVELFSSLNIYPDTLIAFGHVDDINYKSSKPLIHSDIIYDNEKWKKVPFAINWELTDLNPKFSWWDPNHLQEIYPKEIINNDVFKFGNGIHYGSRMNRDSSAMRCLESYVHNQNQAVMIRTEIPHSVTYQSGRLSRTSISLRFPLDQISSWNCALEILKPFMNCCE